MHLHLELSYLHGILSPSAGSVLQIFCGLSHLSQTEIKRNYKLLYTTCHLSDISNMLFVSKLPLTLNFIQWLEFMKALILKKGKVAYCWASFFYREIIKLWEGIGGGFWILNRPVATLQIQKLTYLRSELKELFLSSYRVFRFNLNSKNDGTVLLF